MRIEIQYDEDGYWDIRQDKREGECIAHGVCQVGGGCWLVNAYTMECAWRGLNGHWDEWNLPPQGRVLDHDMQEVEFIEYEEPWKNYLRQVNEAKFEEKV